MNKRVRAVIIKDSQILLIKRIKKDSVYWVLPGGQVEAGEDDARALKRECQEELGIKIEVEKLILTMPSRKIETKGDEEFFYLCQIVGGKIGTGKGPEYAKNTKYIGQYRLEWRNISDLKNIDLKPKEIKDLILSIS